LNINLEINLRYLLNFKPKLGNISNLAVNSNNKIYCKNLLIFIIFLEFFLKKNKYFLNVNLKTFKRKKKLNSFLRAPNKHKKAQISLCTERYYLLVKFNFTFFCNDKMILNLPIFIFYLIDSINFFESTLMLMKTKKIYYQIPLKVLI
jgi:hypothetical protein